MPSRLLVTGASGFVAGVVLAVSDTEQEIYAVSREPAPLLRRNRHWRQIDSLEASDWERLFDEVQPVAVLHTAAIADVDFAQTHPEVCQRVNVDFTATLAGICGSRDIRLVFCSTDTVFDGEHAPYAEDAEPQPINNYAVSKVEAEQVVTRLAPNHVIARLAIVMGLPASRMGNSFLAKLLAALRAGKTAAVPKEEIRTPVDVITLGRALLELAQGEARGIFHLAGNTSLNRLDLNRAAAIKFGLPPALVQPAAAAAIPGRAKRPRDLSLSNARARRELRVPMLDFDAALDQVASFRYPSAE